MVNSIHIIGRLGADPEVKETTTGKKVARFTVATEYGYGDKSVTEWFTVLAWEKLAEICQNYLSKGKLVYVDGRIQTRSYDDKDGNKKYVVELIANNMRMLDKKEEQAPAAQEDDVPF